jgi:hypothetical protein
LSAAVPLTPARTDGETPASTFVVREGRLLAYRMLDVADAIDLVAVERIARTLDCRRGGLTREGSRSLVFAAPPVEIPLDPLAFTLPKSGARLEAEVSARLFDYGAVSIAFAIPIAAGTDLLSLVPLCDELYESPVLDRLAREVVPDLLARLGDAVQRGRESRVIETYTIVFVRELEGRPRARDVLACEALASLVIGESPARALSSAEREDVLKHAHSYFDDDLVVVDWNSAFVLEPSGSEDIPEILELATTQLLELRYYDGVYDAEVARVYREFERVRGHGFRLDLRNPWAELGHQAVRRLVELSEFTERVDNALKVIGDFYLARVYESAVRRFRIRAWQSSIDAKQALLAQAYGLVRGEIESRRSTVLEVIVILLIVLEILLAILRR